MRQKIGRKGLVLLGMLVLAGLLIVWYQGTGGSGGETAEGQDNTTYSFAMGTSVSVTLYDSDDAEQAAVEQEIQTLDTDILSWRKEGSELYELNHTYRVGETYTLSDTLYTALVQATNVCRDSSGALDITIRPLASLWNIEDATAEDFRVPSDAAIADTLESVGYESVSFAEDTAVVIADEGRILDLGAVGKGFALDVVRERLKADGVKGAAISVGGSVLVYGEKSDGSEFRVGIRDPQGTSEDMIGYLTFAAGTDMCISTSGDYEKYIEKDGKRYHHILDRSTGYPADAGLSSVTVVCGNGLYSDALSTACFVLGYEKSLALLEKYDAEAVFIDKDGQITVTDGLKLQFTSS